MVSRFHVRLTPQMNHFDYLESHIPDLKKRRILDLGSGRGKFLFYCIARGVSATGLEINPEYISITHDKARAQGVTVNIVEGAGEKLPFANESFDFINISEVIEHVNDPTQMLSEVWRVLSKDGCAYLSVPNRFGIKDPHFHLYFVNWLPRSLVATYISIRGKHKDYGEERAGHQRLDEMHYYTYSGVGNLLGTHGFSHQDQRVLRIKSAVKNSLLGAVAQMLYLPFRFFVFDSFHILLKKETPNTFPA